MPVRQVVTERQMTAAKLLVDGWPAYRALLKAGYSRWSARNFGLMLRGSWGLRTAIDREQERRQHHWKPAPERKRRFDRKAVVNAIIAAEYQTSTKTERENAQNQRKFADATATCPICRKLVSKKKLIADPSGMTYICETCAQIHYGAFNSYGFS